jgi:hypothetical protein
MSVDYLLKFTSYLERLLNIVLDDHNLELFKKMRNMTLSEHLERFNRLNYHNKELNQTVIANDQMKDIVEKRILDYYEKRNY